MQLNLQIRIQLTTRAKCEQYILAQNAYLSVKHGVNVSMTLTKVRMTCKTGY